MWTKWCWIMIFAQLWPNRCPLLWSFGYAISGLHQSETLVVHQLKSFNRPLRIMLFSFPKIPCWVSRRSGFEKSRLAGIPWNPGVSQLGIQSSQVMMTETGPCLVEVNSRCHGAAGSWMPLARALTGYTQATGFGRENHPFEEESSPHLAGWKCQFGNPIIN